MKTQLRTKNYSIIYAVTFFKPHKLILSLDKKATKSSKLLEYVKEYNFFNSFNYSFFILSYLK